MSDSYHKPCLSFSIICSVSTLSAGVDSLILLSEKVYVMGTFQALLRNHNFAFCYQECCVLMKLHAVASFSVSSLCETVF
jgi:hypothetical protein